MKKVRCELGDTGSFSRENTTKGGRVRVSPISVPIDEYIRAQENLCKLRAHEAQCACSMLIKACAKLRTLGGGRIALRELWKQATGQSPGSGGAAALLNRLMKAPVVAVRIDAANNASAWMVMAKEEDIDYSKLDRLMEGLEPLPAFSGALASRSLISTTRLRAIKLLASSDADRKLIELAALDHLGYMERQRVLGTHNVDSAHTRKTREEKLEVALATFEALTDLAKIKSLSDISARLGVQILESDVESQLQRLKEEVEAQEQQETHDLEAQVRALAPRPRLPSQLTARTPTPYLPPLTICSHPLPPRQADFPMYHTEEVGKDLLRGMDNIDPDLEEVETRIKYVIEDIDFEVNAAGYTDAVPSVLDITYQSEGLEEVFGEDWKQNLRSDMETVEEELDLDDPSLHRLLDDADAMALSVQRELGCGAQPLDVGEGQASGEGAAVNFELISSLDAKQLVVKIIARDRRRALCKARESEALAAARRALGGDRGRAPCLTSIERLHPDIGNKIERIVTGMDIGADAHRQDSAFTFNAATKRARGSGYVRIANELEKQHGISLTPQAVQYLGLARHKRSRSSLRYKALVQMKYRRSVKRVGEEHLDTRASRAFYRIVHYVRDRCSQSKVIFFERDDHARIRQNSSSTTDQHATVTIGVGAGAVQHDYNDPDVCSSLYITSIRAAGLEDGIEVNIAVVKIDKLEPSTPSQHAADLYMLQQLDDLRTQTLFRTSDGGYKSIEHVECDGGPDEDPEKNEVRFLQTERAMGGPLFKLEQRRAQVGATTRSAADTPLNVVERQNGQETETISTFHAATNACGSLLDEVSGTLDQRKVEAMWCHHADRLTALLNGSTGLNDSTMLAVRGATAASCEEARIVLERRPVLVEYTKPNQSKKRKLELEQQHPTLVAHIKKVLAFQARTETRGRYTSTVNTESRDDYPRESVWYEGGPKLKPFPPPYLDPERPGHRMQAEMALSTFASQGYSRKDLNGLDFQWPSDIAEISFERFTVSKPLQPFPADKVAAVVERIGDNSIDAKRLSGVFKHHHFVRLHRMAGARKGAETRKKNEDARRAAAAQKAAADREAARDARPIAAALAACARTAPPAAAPSAPAAAATAVTAATKAAAEKAAKAAAKKAAAEKVAAGAAEEEEDSDDDEEAAAEQLAAAPASRVGQTMEAQQCIADECDFMCGKCSWESCQVTADDGCGRCSVKFDDGEVCDGMLYRFLRMPPHGSKRKR